MTRVAVIGSSHVGAYKVGWDVIAPETPGVEVSFFAAPGKANRTKSLKGMIYGYHAATPGPEEHVVGNEGKRTLDLAPFDHVLKVGDATGEADLGTLIRTHAIDTLGPKERAHRLSLGAFDGFCAALADRRIPRAPWRNWTDGPQLWMVPHPYPDVRALTVAKEKFAPWQSLCADHALLVRLRGRYSAVLTQTLETAGIKLLMQPDQTLAPEGLTRTVFSVGSTDMTNDQDLGDVDMVHMNADYGAVMWQQFLSQIGASATRAARVA